MPVILMRNREKEWLDPKLTREQIESFLKSYNSKEMEAYTVANIVNKMGYNADNPEVVKEFNYTELPELNL